MRAQKVNFIFVEKDPWYKKVVNGLSGRSGNSRYGCSVHGFNTDSSKYKFSNSLAKKASKRPLSSDSVAFSDDEPLYPERRAGVTAAHEEQQKKQGEQTSRRSRTGRPQHANNVQRKQKPVSPMNEDRRISAARAPEQMPWDDSEAATYSTRQAEPLQTSPIRQKDVEVTRTDADIAGKLSTAFDNYDASEQSLGMSAALFQEDVREKKQVLKERFEQASQKDDSFAGKVRRTYESASERAQEHRHTLAVWGACTGIGFVIALAVSLIIVNVNF
jgi:hypothetical protein